MKDQEMIKIIAEKVMGWTVSKMVYNDMFAGESAPFYVNDDNNNCGLVASFNPIEDDKDCMEAWDRFSEGLTTRIEHKNNNIFEVTVGTFNHKQKNIIIKNKDRKRVMCEAMVKKMKEKQNGKG